MSTCDRGIVTAVIRRSDGPPSRTPALVFTDVSAFEFSAEESPSALNRNAPLTVSRGQELVLGTDVEERDLWGLDCLTRRCLFDAVALAPGFRGKAKVIYDWIEC
eukprot:795307-Prorocentrum_minimum.AAC.2